ncbi:hypothetical protein GQ457_14G026830 [Hibiscus cannabinus]
MIKSLDLNFCHFYSVKIPTAPARRRFELIALNLEKRARKKDLNGPEITRQNQEGINHTRIFSNIPKGSAYQREGKNKVKVKDLKPKRIKDYLECKISQRNLNQPRKSTQAGPVVSSRDIPFFIQLKQIIEAPR